MTVRGLWIISHENGGNLSIRFSRFVTSNYCHIYANITYFFGLLIDRCVLSCLVSPSSGGFPPWSTVQRAWQVPHM